MATWEYIVDDVYEDASFVPSNVPPGRLMNEEERIESYNMTSLGRKVVTAWTMTKYLQARGKQGWELIHAERLITGNEYEPAYWKCFFKRPSPAAARVPS